MATPGRRKAHRAPRKLLVTRTSSRTRPPETAARETPQARLEALPLRSTRRRPATLAGLLIAGVATVAASAPQVVTTTAASVGGTTDVGQTHVLASPPSLEQHIAERREVAVSRSSERQALPQARAGLVAGVAEATAEPEEDGESADGSESDSPSTSVSGKPCASGSSVESGLTSNAIKVHRAVCAEFPSVTSYGGVRSGDGGEHGSGRALDIMVSGATGDQIADYVRANASRLGVTEVLWAQQIWTTQRASEGWRSMEDRGSSTANHYDHVHVTVG
ncbi:MULTISPECIES: SH3 domain-containing protein [Mumia]|uniref:SH3 domain-containing protein n=1 Tax=Mumia TaxID=1546255 RepID=UPI001AB05903|nr:SH3 domain-containing protein [Mumia sp. ZJ430]